MKQLELNTHNQIHKFLQFLFFFSLNLHSFQFEYKRLIFHSMGYLQILNYYQLQLKPFIFTFHVPDISPC